MRKSKGILLGLILLSSGWIEGGKSLSAQQSPQVKAPAPKETGHCTLTFQYVEGPGLLPPLKPGAQERPSVISANERTAWLAKVQGKPDVWMMKEPVTKSPFFGPARQVSTLSGSGSQRWANNDCFGVKEGKPWLSNYHVTAHGKGAKVALDLAMSVQIDGEHIPFYPYPHLELAEGDTLVLQSPHHPRKNVDCVMLVTAKNRPLPPERVVRLELLYVDGGDLPSPGFSWSCFNAECQNGVPEKEIRDWFQKSGTTLEARTTKKTRKELKNTESWSIVEDSYETPTKIYSEVIGSVLAFYVAQKINMVEFTEEDKVTKHTDHVQLVPDPANENASYPFVLISEFWHQRGARSSWGSRAKNTPKPGHYLTVDTTKPHAKNWTMLLIRPVEDGGF